MGVTSRQRGLPMCGDKVGSAGLVTTGLKIQGKKVLGRRDWSRGEWNRQVARPLQSSEQN